jgi:hypothetical protein
LKLENKTQEESAILLIRYFLTLFNSSILLLIINANFTGTGIPLEFIDGFYGDFDAKWFAYVAPIFITPMFIRCALAPIVPIFKYLVKKFLILWDKRGLCSAKICYSSLPQNEDESNRTQIYTSKKLNLPYANLFSGHKLELSNPYPKVLVAVMISMMFGIILPVLFPLTLLFIVLIYLTFKI